VRIQGVQLSCVCVACVEVCAYYSGACPRTCGTCGGDYVDTIACVCNLNALHA
jgi:hypothetical protein